MDSRRCRALAARVAFLFSFSSRLASFMRCALSALFFFSSTLAAWFFSFSNWAASLRSFALSSACCLLFFRLLESNKLWRRGPPPRRRELDFEDDDKEPEIDWRRLVGVRTLAGGGHREAEAVLPKSASAEAMELTLRKELFSSLPVLFTGRPPLSLTLPLAVLLNLGLGMRDCILPVRSGTLFTL